MGGLDAVYLGTIFLQQPPPCDARSMNAMPDSSWLQALKLPLRVMIGMFIASVVLLGLDSAAILHLDDFGQLAKPITIVMIVLSGALSITGVCALVYDHVTSIRKHTALTVRRQLRQREFEEQKRKAEKATLERIEYLSPSELRHLARCLREGSQSFYTYVHSPSVTTLMGKGLVYTPGGTHHQDHYPFTIFDFVWKALLARKDEILAWDQANKKREEENKRRGRY